MQPINYIESQLTSLSNPAPISKPSDLSGFISKSVLSKKFRKYSVDEDFTSHLANVIANCVSENLPIPFVWDFGGYKLRRLTEAPEVDWAELFTLIYFSRWLIPITQVYPPGVWFDFYSEDVFIPHINNISPTDTSAYLASFSLLLTYIKKFLPPNFRFTLSRLIDQYPDPTLFHQEFARHLTQLSEHLPNGLPVLTPEQAATVELNVNLRPGQDQDPLWKERVQLIHDAYSLASKRRPYYRNPSKILVNNVSTKCAIAPGTTRASVVKFWIGAGLLEHRGNTYIDRILTPRQLSSIASRLEPINLSGLTGRNFQHIRITDAPFP